jgi:hypothetical protein
MVWCGFTKSVCKILRAKGLKVKILITNDLSHFPKARIYRLRLDHDLLIVGVRSRSDATEELE